MVEDQFILINKTLEIILITIRQIETVVIIIIVEIKDITGGVAMLVAIKD